MSTEETGSVVYDCMVLSGGGANGAYGAGAASAILAYRTLKQITHPICFVGASAGALNAYLLASDGWSRIKDFWIGATNSSILGAPFNVRQLAAALRWTARRLAGTHQPHSVFGNTALRKLIQTHARLAAIHSPLILACTDYTQGKLRAFYVSDLVRQFIDADMQREANARRLFHFRPIEDDEKLVDALLASAAIPVFFPPVRMTVTRPDGVEERSWFVDGGVGNNTPTREAAYFLRFLEDLKLGTLGTTYCITQDPPTIYKEGQEQMDLLQVSKRTLEVFQYAHMEPIVRRWDMINTDAEKQGKRIDELIAWTQKNVLDPAARREIIERADRLRPRQKRMPMISFGPSASLGDPLDFDPKRAREIMRLGYVEALRELVRRGRIDDAESDSLDTQF